MKIVSQVLVVIFLWMLATTAPGQSASSRHSRNNLNRMSVDAVEDMGKVKLLAERGNVNAQLKIASYCMNNRLFVEALKWYSAAADQGSLEARYQKGHLLLYGSDLSAPEQRVAASPIEGLKLIYQTATNHYVGAYYDMGQVLKEGIGCAPDAVAAYAWFSLYTDVNTSANRRLMNDLAVQLSTEDIRKAMATAREMKTNHWLDLPPPPAAKPAATQTVSIKLRLSGLICSPHGNLAIINNHTLGKGETGQFMTEQKELVAITCQRIHTDSVEVLVEGETQPRLLTASMQ